MKPKELSPQSSDLFRYRLDEIINMTHPLVKLAQLIDWSVFEREWAVHFPSNKGRPASSARLVVGLIYLQHPFNCSDEKYSLKVGWRTRIGSIFAGRAIFSISRRLIIRRCRAGVVAWERKAWSGCSQP